MKFRFLPDGSTMSGRLSLSIRLAVLVVAVGYFLQQRFAPKAFQPPPEPKTRLALVSALPLDSAAAELPVELEPRAPVSGSPVSGSVVAGSVAPTNSAGPTSSAR